MSEKTDRVIWQVTDTTGVPILGRAKAKLMNYTSYLEIHPSQEQSIVSQDSLKSTDYIHSLKITGHSLQSTKTTQFMYSPKTTPEADQTAQEEHKAATMAKTSTTHEPKSAQVSWCKSSITINGKNHPLPTTKECILHEYADVFKGVGTLPGGPYHIKLKDSYKPVQHQPRSVQLGMQSAYKAELDRLMREGIITVLHEHTEWINSIVPVMKEDGSLRLCLDPKDLNKAIERNQWYARTLDDILPELAQSKYFTIKDAISGFWHIILDFRSSLLATFNTLWDKYRWLRMPFGLKVSGDVFQERLDKVLRLVPRVLGITDDIVIHGAMENTHDGTVYRLQVLQAQTDPRQHQSGPQEDKSHNTHGATSECCKSPVFQWYGELPEEIQPSLIQTLRTPKKTMQVWSQMGMEV